MNHKRSNGERVGNIAYGFRLAADSRKLEPDPQKQAVLMAIRDLRMKRCTLRGSGGTERAGPAHAPGFSLAAGARGADCWASQGRCYGSLVNPVPTPNSSLNAASGLRYKVKAFRLLISRVADQGCRVLVAPRPIGDVKPSSRLSLYNFYNFLTSSLRLNGVIVPSIEVCPGESRGAVNRISFAGSQGRQSAFSLFA